MDMLDVLGFLLAIWETAKPFLLSFLVIMIASLAIKNLVLDKITKELEVATSHLSDISNKASRLEKQMLDIEQVLRNLKDSRGL
jgi:hypothetical protein